MKRELFVVIDYLKKNLAAIPVNSENLNKFPVRWETRQRWIELICQHKKKVLSQRSESVAKQGKNSK